MAVQTDRKERWWYNIIFSLRFTDSKFCDVMYDSFVFVLCRSDEKWWCTYSVSDLQTLHVKEKKI